MGRRLAGWAACGWLVLCAPAAASAYSDFNAGIAAYAIAQCDRALPHLTAAIAAPDLLANLKPVALLVRGGCYAKQKNFDAAIADFDRALALRPAYIDAYLARGYARARSGAYDAALADFDAVTAARPDLPNGLGGRSFVHLRRKQYDALVEDLSKQAEVDDEPVRIYVLRADANVLKGDLDAAMEDADKLVSLAPDATLGFIIRGRVDTHEARYDRAEQAFDRALRLQPASEPALFGKGIAQWSAKEFVSAAGTFEAAAGVAPKDAYSLLWLAIARATAHKSNDDFAARAKDVDLSAWPGPLVSLYAGNSTPDAAIAAARTGDPDDVEPHVCEAEFYTGEWQLRHDAKDAAMALLNRAAQDCARNDTEWDVAGIELKRLGS